MKIVLDTNVYASAFLFGGKPRRIVEHALEGKYEICLSEAMLIELEGVLRRPKFGLDPEIVRTLIIAITEIPEMVVPLRRHRIVKSDPEDNMIIDCAAAAGADFIVSGDAHLLDLGKFGKTGILNPDEFIAALKLSL